MAFVLLPRAEPGRRAWGRSFLAILSGPPEELQPSQEEELAVAPGTNGTSVYHIPEGPVHEQLETIVRKHIRHRDLWRTQRRLAGHTATAFEDVTNFVASFHAARQDQLENDMHMTSPSQVQGSVNQLNPSLPLVLDSGCGTGRSTLEIGRRYPDLPVIGIDKSVVRLSRTRAFREQQADLLPPNVKLVRADLIDFWVLASDLVARGRWDVKHHFILYPNPYPKGKQVKQRWHGHPVFPFLLDLEADELTLRSSWETYLFEFAEALRVSATATTVTSTSTAKTFDGGLHTGTDSDPVTDTDTDTDTVTAGAIASPTASFVGSALQSMVSTPSGVEKGPKDDAPAGEAGALRGAGGPDPGSIARLYLTDVPLGPVRLVHDTGLFMTNFEEKYEAVGQPTYEMSLRLMRDGPLRQS